jgi:hypothetical protein
MLHRRQQRFFKVVVLAFETIGARQRNAFHRVQGIRLAAERPHTHHQWLLALHSTSTFFARVFYGASTHGDTRFTRYACRHEMA